MLTVGTPLLLQAELLGLFMMLYLLLVYVGVPLGLLVLFFRSRHVPRVLKQVGAGLLGLLLAVAGIMALGPWWRSKRPPEPQYQPVRLTVQQLGLLPYPLGTGKIEVARYDSVRLLIVSGIMPDGNVLRASFSADARLAQRDTTNRVAVAIQDRAAPQAVGQSSYQAADKLVNGHFWCVLPTGDSLRCAFGPTLVVVQ